jgi:glycosyltransferase involved in cell wall biosynthesis
VITQKPLSIVQVNTYERRGGAASVARQLFEAYRSSGHHSMMMVGRGEASDPDVRLFPESRFMKAAHLTSGPLRILDRHRGRETYRYPGTRALLRMPPDEVDIVHLHNLHGGYFDLRLLPALSDRFPVVVTLHDAWLLSGHCSHSFECERWRTGCGQCPDLKIYPAVRRDATAANWSRKRDIFRRSRLYIASPSQWLADKVRGSILAASVEELRVLPNGVDLAAFSPGDRPEARRSLALPANGHVLLTTGERLRTNEFKDLDMTLRAVGQAAESIGEEITLLVLGDTGPEQRLGKSTIRYVPYQLESDVVARHYQSADLYLHAARADTFPLSVLEALACGTPVVATSVGGIPEQIESLRKEGSRWISGSAENASGILVAAGDADEMARAIAHLLTHPKMTETLGKNGRAEAGRRFGVDRQCDSYLSWYRNILSRPATHPRR